MSFINFNILGNEVPINAHAITVIKVVPSAPDKWLVQVDWMPKNSAIVKLNEAGYYETQKLAQAAADILAQEVADIVNAGGEGTGGLPQVQSDWEQTNTTKVDYIKNKPNLSDYVKNTIKINGKQLTSNITLLSKDIITDSEDGFFAGQTIEVSLEYLNDNLGDKNVKADWNETDSTKDSYIENKPTIPNVTNFITKDVADLTNYYDKTTSDSRYIQSHQSLANYYTKTEIDSMVGDVESALDAILGV